MSRLFYSQPASEASLMSGGNNIGIVTEKVVKLIPSEILAGYIVLIEFVPLVGPEAFKPWFFIGIFFVCLFLTPIYLYRLAEKNKPSPKIHMFISSIAFIVWAYYISGESAVPQYYDSGIAAIVMGVFTLITGVIPLD